MANKPPHRLRWLWIGLAVFMTVPIALVCTIRISFSLNSIGPEQLAPRPEFLETKTARAQARRTTAAALVIPQNKIPVSYDECLAAAAPEASTLYRYFNGLFWAKPNDFDPFTSGWDPARPLSAENAKWLEAHHEMIEKALRLAALGGVPHIAPERAAVMRDEELSLIPVPNQLPFQQITNFLIAECQRRRTAGDLKGAAEALLAIEPLAESVGEPTLIGYLNAQAMRRQACAELARWLENPPPDDIAAMIRERLANARTPELRHCMRLHYREQRHMLISKLQGSFKDVMRFMPGARRNEGLYHRSLWGLIDDITDLPGGPIGEYSQAAYDSMNIKSSASELVNDFDARYAAIFNKITPAEKVQAGMASSKMDRAYALFEISFPSVDEYLARDREIEALRASNLARLRNISGSH